MHGSCGPAHAPPRLTGRALPRAAQGADAGAAAAPEPTPEGGDDLEARVAALTAEAEALAEEGLAKDEEIEALEGRLAHAAKARAPRPAHGVRRCKPGAARARRAEPLGARRRTPARLRICAAAWG